VHKNLDKWLNWLLHVHSDYDIKLLGPAIREFGFDRFLRTHVLACKAAASIDPHLKVNPHLQIAMVWKNASAAIKYYWDKCKSPVSSILVVDEWVRSISSNAEGLANAYIPLAKSEDPVIFRHSWWASCMLSINDYELLANSFATIGGIEPLIREATDSTNKSQVNLLIAVNNGARFSVASKAMMDLNASTKLAPLVYSADSKVSLSACMDIATLCLHNEHFTLIESSGVLSDVLVVQRAAMDVQSAGVGFATPDIATSMAMCHKDRPLALRMCGLRELLKYTKAAQEAVTNGSSTPLELLKTAGVVERARELAVDGDAFLYVHAVKLLNAMNLPTPYYRDPSIQAVQNANSESNVLAWSIEDVCSWVGKHSFHAYCAAFREALIDGSSLSTLSDAELVEMGVISALHRKAIRSSIGRLLSKAGFIYEHAPVIASAAAVDSVDNLGSPRSPRPHTPHTSLHLRSFTASGDAGIENEDTKDVFISYRRKTGAVLAQLLAMHFKANGLRVFLDVENLGTGAFDVALRHQLTVSRNVVVVLSEGALDRCLNDHENKDFVRKEIAMALLMEKNIVPVICDDFKWPETYSLPEDMRGLPSRNGIPWSHMYQDACVTKLISFLKMSL
jgi:hypothetical protein